MGCDKELHSDKVPDRCGRCDGLGTTCEFRTANYTKDHRRYGTAHLFLDRAESDGRNGKHVIFTMSFFNCHMYFEKFYNYNMLLLNIT